MGPRKGGQRSKGVLLEREYETPLPTRSSEIRALMLMVPELPRPILFVPRARALRPVLLRSRVSCFDSISAARRENCIEAVGRQQRE